MHSNKNMSENKIFDIFNNFLKAYFTERNPEQAVEFLSEQFYSIGTGKDEVALNRDEYKNLLYEGKKIIPGEIKYIIKKFDVNEFLEGIWKCQSLIEVTIDVEDAIAKYDIRMSAVFHMEKGTYLLDILHTSEPARSHDEGEFFPVKLVSESVNKINSRTKKDFFEIMEQVMPGGIIGGYDEEGFPLYVANSGMIEMSGYNDIDEFRKDIDGLIINSIHPDDCEYVCNTLKERFINNEDFQVEYRMKKKDGSYIWIHVLGKKTEDDEGRKAIISMAFDISSYMDENIRLKIKSECDELTGLKNRRGGETRIREELKDIDGYAFVILDIDNFKEVNDVYGHIEGDKVLVDVAERMKECFRETDIIYRLGGDEFVVFVREMDDPDIVRNRICHITEEYKDFMKKNYKDIKTSISAGGVWSNKAYSFEILYKKADEVLYKIKNNHKGKVIIEKI